MASVQIIGPSFSNFVRSVMLACYEKGIEFRQSMEYQGEQCAPGTLALEKLNPFGKMPVLVHDGLVIFETVAILRYLDREFEGPELQSGNSAQLALIDQWSSACASQVDRAVVREYLLEIIKPLFQGGEVNRQRLSDAEPGVAKVLAIMERQLGEEGFLIGDQFSIADALAAPMLDYLLRQADAQALVADVPRVQAYVERLRARESGRRVLVAPDFSL
ncbi:glutathione S-transferase family protein [Halomonas huangheensis]|uniref:glutathione transferase n=1 Tax=Halomonas huangheensis TaxID=1178482 RepID=W1N7G5_9GAMM|nr:glutathione S-transferase family protein [Halomonas huangheensis]ALM51107.1 hypothetical protein AR456_01455 [Halomonas huangheensis]ERL51136.1 hypothetical protein BJB45_14625 [Halomonas huangheensis]